MRIILLAAAALALAGCVRTAANVVTFPVRAAAQGVDWATTSRDEADRNRGRKLRKQEERDAKAQRKAAKRAAQAEREARRRSRDD